METKDADAPRGHLWKRGRGGFFGRKNWKKRWFDLRPGTGTDGEPPAWLDYYPGDSSYGHPACGTRLRRLF